MSAQNAPLPAGTFNPAGFFTGGRRWLPALLLALMTFAVYYPAIRGEFVWDDDRYAANPVLARSGGLLKIWTLQYPAAQCYKEFPVVYTSFWLERRLWGLRPEGYHLINICLHIFNALLAWLLLKKLRVRGAWLAAAVFSLHPVHVESVAWISERKNVLSGLFYLLALGGYLKFEEGRGRGWYAGSLALFLLALLSKPVTCTLPAVLLLLRWMRGLEIQRRHLAGLLPFFLLALAAGLFTLFVEVTPLEPELAFTPAQRLLLAGRALWFYPLKLLWPADLAFSYARWNLDSGSAVQWLWVLGALGAGLWVWLAGRRTGRYFASGLIFYAITILPVLGFVSNYTFHFSFVADHYQYLASLGLIAAGVGGFTGALARFRPGSRYAGPALGAALLLLLGQAAWRQAGVYKGPDLLWADTLKKNPGSWMAHNNLCFSLTAQGKLDAALLHCREAVKLKPGYAQAYNNLGIISAAQGRPAEAGRHYREALRLDPLNAEAHSNLGLLLAAQGDPAAAERHYREAIRLNPEFAQAHNNLGIVLAAQGRLDAAAQQSRAALGLLPDFAQAHANLGIILTAQGRPDEAARHYREALRLDSGLQQAHNNLAAILMGQGRLDEAAAQNLAALKAAPGSALSRYNLGLILAAQGKSAEAAEQYRAALRLDAGFAQAHNNLGLILAAQGKSAEAADHYRAALRLAPGFAQAHANFGVLLAAQNRPDAAAEHYRAALQLAPGFAQAHALLAGVLLAQGKQDEAELHYRAALKLDPQLAQAHSNLAVILVGQGKLEEAEKHYLEALRIAPDLAEAHYNLSAILAAQGRNGEAETHRRRALQLDPCLGAAAPCKNRR
ncbi:MAG TPA: tetratricopeptide repeat protein [Elusimicrobiales bacterium]|nr:tetratricopeptide repeat protein [Elusimicrobiales bacterium]